MDFVTIDFETANEKRSSPCSLGLTVVKNNKIVEEKYWLIRPKELRFSPMNVWIHGIREGDVVDAPEMDELWEEIRPYLEKQWVFAHNASFDMSVLRNTLDEYDIPYPNLRYGCTVILAKNFFPFLENAKLNTVNQFLNFEFQHHHAGADATACANIILETLKELQIHDMKNFLEVIGMSPGKLYADGYKAAKNLGKSVVSSRSIPKKDHKKKATEYNSIAFVNQTVVFTGPLSSMSRFEAQEKVLQRGGAIGSSVTKKTTTLVTPIKDVHALSPMQQSNKLRKALTLIKEGQAIKILSEQDFLKLL